VLDELAMYADAEKQNSTGWAVFLGGAADVHLR